MAKKARISELVKELSKEGQRIVANQLNNVGYTHRTYNLNDSYGFGVYLEGKLVSKGFSPHKASGSKMWENEIISGRKAITDFLENKYKPHPGIDLVIAVAMPYGEIVEEKYKYEVLSTARNDVEQLTSKFKNANFGIISHGSY